MAIKTTLLCRLCISKDTDLIELFSEDGENNCFVDMIFKYISIQVSRNDGFSQQICKECIKKITAFNEFVSSCLQNQKLLSNSITENFSASREQESSQNINVKSEDYFLEKHDTLFTDSYDDIYFDNDEDCKTLADIKNDEQYIKPVENSITVKRKRGRPKKNKPIETNIEIKKESDIDAFSNIEELLSSHNLEQCGDNYLKLKLEPNSDIELFTEELPTLKRKRGRPRDENGADYSIYCFSCHICDVIFGNWYQLRSHVKNIHKAAARVMCICSKYLSSRKSLLKHIAQHDPTKCVRCDKCSKIFATQKELTSHSYTHMPKEELPFVCCKCGKRFGTQRILKTHERIHLTREERFIWSCLHCGAKLSTKGALSTHIRVVHEKLRPFVCDLCGHACSTRANLEEHHQRHGDQKNFTCDQCQKKFKTKGALIRHTDTHGDTAYQCPKCPMLLNSRRTLRNHLYVHDDVPRHNCRFCGKTFKRRKDIKCHLKLHTGEKPYSCPWCSRTFTNGSNCRIHKRRMHPVEFQLAERNNPYAPTNNEKKIPKKVIHTVDILSFPMTRPVQDGQTNDQEELTKLPSSQNNVS